MKNNRNSAPATPIISAFSLVELSAVLMIIAVIITGVLTGSNIIYTAKIAAARSLTAFAPVGDIEDLKLWLETTSKDSFDSNEAVDGSSISTWYDINIQKGSTGAIDATQSTAANQPTYTKNGMNGLPAISFDGSNDYLIIDRAVDTDWTIFVVYQAIAVTNGTGSSDWWRGAGLFDMEVGGGTNDFGLAVADNADLMAGTGKSGISDVTINQSSLSFNNNYIGIYTRESSSGDMALYVNGSSAVTTTGSTGQKTAADRIIIGAIQTINRFLEGYIGEIIAYDRVLSTLEREQIEEYLSKKWKIDLD